MTASSSSVSRYASGLCLAIALLAGCGGSQPPIGAPGTMPQSHAIATHADRGTSWMLPEAKSDDLLYVAQAGDREGVWVFSFPQGKLLGKLIGISDAFGLCSDGSGNVFVTEADAGEGEVLEYAHGGTSPLIPYRLMALSPVRGIPRKVILPLLSDHTR
jgi:hypothetical protein